LPKISIFAENFYFCRKFRLFWMKISIFVENFDFSGKFQSLTKFSHDPVLTLRKKYILYRHQSFKTLSGRKCVLSQNLWQIKFTWRKCNNLIMRDKTPNHKFQLDLIGFAKSIRSKNHKLTFWSTCFNGAKIIE